MLAYGLYRCGAGSMPAMRRRLVQRELLRGLAEVEPARRLRRRMRDYPTRPCCSTSSGFLYFEYRFSICSATSASLTLRMRPAMPARSNPTASGNSCRASCCVMVLRPGVRPPRQHVVHRGPRHEHGMDAAVRHELAVFGGDDGVPQHRRNVFVGNDLSAFGRELADDRAVPAEDARDDAGRVVVERRDFRQVVGEGEQDAGGRAKHAPRRQTAPRCRRDGPSASSGMVGVTTVSLLRVTRRHAARGAACRDRCRRRAPMAAVACGSAAASAWRRRRRAAEVDAEAVRDSRGAARSGTATRSAACRLAASTVAQTAAAASLSESWRRTRGRGAIRNAPGARSGSARCAGDAIGARRLRVIDFRSRASRRPESTARTVRGPGASTACRAQGRRAGRRRSARTGCGAAPRAAHRHQRRTSRDRARWLAARRLVGSSRARNLRTADARAAASVGARAFDVGCRLACVCATVAGPRRSATSCRAAPPSSSRGFATLPHRRTPVPRSSATAAAPRRTSARESARCAESRSSERPARPAVRRTACARPGESRWARRRAASPRRSG